MTREQLIKPKTKEITLADGTSKVKARKLTQNELEACHVAFKDANGDEIQALALSRNLIAKHLLNDEGGKMFDSPEQVGDMDHEDIAAVVSGLLSKPGNV